MHGKIEWPGRHTVPSLNKPECGAIPHKHGIHECARNVPPYGDGGRRLRVVSWPHSDGEITTPTPLTAA